MAAVPLLPSLVAVIVAEPTTTAVSRPLLLTVATAVLELVHVTVRPVRVLPLASFRVAVAWSVPPTATLGDARLTVTVATGARRLPHGSRASSAAGARRGRCGSRPHFRSGAA